MIRLPVVLGLFILVLGCGRGQPNTSGGLTADDLAYARGIKWWFVEVPDIPDGKTLCMSIVDEEGVVENRGCPRAAPGDRLKVVLSDFDNWNLRYSIVTNDYAVRSEIINHFVKYDGPTSDRHCGDIVTVGDFLVKRSNTNKVGGVDNPLQPMEIGLVFTIEDKAQHWKREGYEPPGERWKARAVREAGGTRPSPVPIPPPSSGVSPAPSPSH